MAPVKSVRKAVIPVAGNGTRFLPATKAMPKEMLTIVDRPVVQYAVEEAMQAGIEHIVFVTGRNKQAIEDHFDDVPELISSLTRSGKDAQISELARMLPTAGSVSFTRQQAPLGLGHAVWCARDLIGDEPFALLLPDMISYGARGCMAGLMDLYNDVGGNVVAVEECAPEETSKYGIVGMGAKTRHGFEVTQMVEKPPCVEAPSTYLPEWPLHPSARNLLDPRAPAARRRQRDPADRRHAAPFGDRSRSTPILTKAGPSTVAPSRASSRLTLPLHLHVPTSAISSSNPFARWCCRTKAGNSGGLKKTAIFRFSTRKRSGLTPDVIWG